MNAVDIEFRPLGSLGDPCLDEGLLFRGDEVAFRWHAIFFVSGGDACEERALFWVSSSDGRAVEFATFEGRGESGEVKVAFCFFALVTGKAFRFENGQDLLVEVNLSGFVFFDLRGGFLDSGVQKMIDLIICRKTFSRSRKSDCFK